MAKISLEKITDKEGRVQFLGMLAEQKDRIQPKRLVEKQQGIYYVIKNCDKMVGIFSVYPGSDIPQIWPFIDLAKNPEIGREVISGVLSAAVREGYNEVHISVEYACPEEKKAFYLGEGFEEAMRVDETIRVAKEPEKPEMTAENAEKKEKDWETQRIPQYRVYSLNISKRLRAAADKLKKV